MKQYYFYILSSANRRLYVGVKNNLPLRLWRHRNGQGSTFAMPYHISRLLHYEVTQSVHSAIEREKQIKAWRRRKKIELIESGNPDWSDLAIDWGMERGGVATLTVDPSSLRSSG